MTESPRIPFNRACFVGTEQRYIAEAVGGGMISGDGPFGKRCERWLEERTGAQRALLTTSCTHALEMAALLLDLAPGDEVIVPSFTFVSTANAFVMHGAIPRFADVHPLTLNLDPESVEQVVSSRTRAIVPVHYGGVACEMDRLTKLGAEHGFSVIEDNAHGLLGTYRGRPLGSLGSMATQSFHETKNFTCGEGGALLINDSSLIDRAEILREKGTNRSRFFRGMVDKYTWVDVGSSYVMSDVLGAFLFAQLEEAPAIQAKRAHVWSRYQSDLAAWAEANGVQQPVVPPDAESSHHLYHLLLPSLAARRSFIDHLATKGILSVFHYLPLHLSPMGQRYGGRVGQCPVTESVADRLVRLPFYNDLSDEDQGEVIAAIRELHFA